MILKKWLILVPFYFGNFIGRCHISHMGFYKDKGKEYFTKKRNLFSYSIPIANWFMKLRQVPIQILNEQEWLEREVLFHKLLGYESLSVFHGTTLKIPKQAGQTLEEIITNNTAPWRLKKIAVGECTRTLYQLHQLEWQGQYLSHGDATAYNVIYDFDKQGAYWFDFEQKHLPYITHKQRHADDVRALIFSTMINIHKDKFYELLIYIRALYPNQEIFSIIRNWIENKQLDLDWVHYAQIHCSVEKYKQCLNQIYHCLREIEKVNDIKHV